MKTIIPLDTELSIHKLLHLLLQIRTIIHPSHLNTQFCKSLTLQALDSALALTIRNHRRQLCVQLDIPPSGCDHIKPLKTNSIISTQIDSQVSVFTGTNKRFVDVSCSYKLIVINNYFPIYL